MKITLSIICMLFTASILAQSQNDTSKSGTIKVRKSQTKDEAFVIEEVSDFSFTVVEIMPEFSGGNIALEQFISDSLRYPEDARLKKTQGIVYIGFVVDTSGAVTNVKVLSGLTPSLNKEAVRVVSSFPRFRPGLQKGRPVNVSYNVPVRFSLK